MQQSAQLPQCRVERVAHKKVDTIVGSVLSAAVARKQSRKDIFQHTPGYICVWKITRISAPGGNRSRAFARCLEVGNDFFERNDEARRSGNDGRILMNRHA